MVRTSLGAICPSLWYKYVRILTVFNTGLEETSIADPYFGHMELYGGHLTVSKSSDFFPTPAEINNVTTILFELSQN